MDALVYWDAVSFPGVVVPCRPIGVVRLEQDSRTKLGRRVRNDWIVAVPVNHSRLATPSPIPRRTSASRVRDEIAQFFPSSAIFFEPKNPALLGWGGPEEAERAGGRLYRK